MEPTKSSQTDLTRTLMASYCLAKGRVRFSADKCKGWFPGDWENTGHHSLVNKGDPAAGETKCKKYARGLRRNPPQLPTAGAQAADGLCLTVTSALTQTHQTTKPPTSRRRHVFLAAQQSAERVRMTRTMQGAEKLQTTMDSLVIIT